MSNDDLDLDAWEAPPPPDGLADAVVARMAEPAVDAPLHAEPAPHRRRWVIAASAAAALVAAGGIWALVRHRERAPAQNGAVIAERAQHVELPGASADLDRGADIHWHRTADGLDIEQRGGTAVWRVPADERIVIGASVASIEAAGASLRVEVPMNNADGRVIGASAVTAAAVALLTVVVYEGHVKVASSGQTVVVQPGTTYTIPAPKPVPPQDLVGASVLPDEPAAADVEKLVASKAADLAQCLGNNRGEPTLIFTIDTDGRVSNDALDGGDSADDASSCMMYALLSLKFPPSKHGGKYAYAVKPPSCDADALTKQGMALVNKGDQPGALAKFEEALACKPDGPTYQLAFMASCNAKNVPKAAEYWGKLRPGVQSRMLQICVRNGIDRGQLDPASCDVEALTDKALASEQFGKHAEALAGLEAAIKCQPSTRLYQLAFMASCNAKSVSKSQYYWKRIPTASHGALQQMCMRNGIMPETLDGLAGAAVDAASGQGQVRIDCIPQAKVLFDGVAAGTTPVLLKAAPGKHKVTYVIGDDRFTYPVVVKAGYTETLSKDLQ